MLRWSLFEKVSVLLLFFFFFLLVFFFLFLLLLLFSFSSSAYPSSCSRCSSLLLFLFLFCALESHVLIEDVTCRSNCSWAPKTFIRVDVPFGLRDMERDMTLFFGLLLELDFSLQQNNIQNHQTTSNNHSSQCQAHLWWFLLPNKLFLPHWRAVAVRPPRSPPPASHPAAAPAPSRAAPRRLRGRRRPRSGHRAPGARSHEPKSWKDQERLLVLHLENKLQVLCDMLWQTDCAFEVRKLLCCLSMFFLPLQP